MTTDANLVADKSERAEAKADPCQCSLFDAVNDADITESDIETGNIETADTGCSETTTRTFAPGHDAKLKSFLIRYELLGWSIRFGAPLGLATITDAVSHANKYGFGHMVADGIKRGQAKAAAKIERAEKRAAEKELRDAIKADAKKTAPAGAKPQHDGNAARQNRELAAVVAAEEAKHAEAVKAEVAAREAAAEWGDAEVVAPAEQANEPVKATAKVGRWKYEGSVDADGKFHYLNKRNQKMTAPKGTYDIVS